MGEEKQFGVMNGKPEPEISAAGKTHGWTKSDFTSNGNLKRDYFKSHSYAPPTTLDSDGTLGSSGNESDSSEELHYGPGFVSRLKSRYMSVALRGSTGLYGKSGNRKLSNLRRTASLEDFLDQEKNEEQIEIRETIASGPPKPTFTKNRVVATGTGNATGRFRPKVTSSAAVESRVSRSKERTRQDSIIKRCQSVEVLSNDRMIRKSSIDNSKPPPLPPKTERPLENILNSTLANDNIVVDEKVVDKNVDKSVKFRKVSPEASPTSMASLKKPFHKRRSSGLLFGVEERELPAPDTVKETRKIFESFDKTGVRPSSSFLTKSQSTSSLYSAPAFSRSPTRDRTSIDVLASSRLTRKKSDENVNLASLRTSSPQRRVSYVNYINNKSSLYRNNATTQKLNATSKPTLPTKPSNLNFGKKDSVDHETNTVPVLPAKKNSIASQTSSSEKKVTVRKPAVEVSGDEMEEGMKPISSDSLKNIRQSGVTYSFSFQSENALSKNQNYLPTPLSSSPTSKQVGVIKPITRDAETSPVMKHDDSEKEVIILKKEDRESELPPSFLRPSTVKKSSPESTLKSSNAADKTSKFSPPMTTWMTVGAAMKSDKKPELIIDELSPVKFTPEAPPIPATRNVRFANDGQILTATPATIVSSDSSEDTEDSSSIEPPVVPPPRIHEKNPHQFLPPFNPALKPVSLQQPEKLLNPLITPKESKPVNHYVKDPKQVNAVVKDPKPSAPVVKEPKPVKSVVAKEDKPVYPVATKVDKPVSPIVTKEEKPSSPPRSPLQTHQSVETSTSLSSLAKPKKKAEPATNSMVFNFVNSEKNVTHIENDGLDMSKRKNLKNTRDSGIVILAGVGESTDDTDNSDADDIDHTRPVSPCNVTFIGANVVHGKSSLRSKTKAKKMSISFSSSLPEVFEYPSYEAPTNVPPVANPTPLKSTNNSIGSFGGLGSYTPSKIHGLDNSFQLGVTRTPAASKSEMKNAADNVMADDDADVITTSESLWPAKDAVSWSGTTSAFSDMLF